MNLPPEERLRADLSAILGKYGETASPQVLDALAIHLRLLERWNPRYRLTTIQSWEEILRRHVAESLTPLRWIGPEGRLLDIGSGNGFPGVPILACRQGIEGVLVERSERKSLFLEAVLRETGRRGARVETRSVGMRGKDVGRERFEYVISRATLPPHRYLRVAASWALEGGRVFLYAGLDAEPLCNSAEDHGLKLTAREPIEGRRDSYLFVLDA